MTAAIVTIRTAASFPTPGNFSAETRPLCLLAPDSHGTITLTVIDIYDVTLTVTDNDDNTDQDTAVFECNNIPPVADAGPDLTQYKNTEFLYDGRNSFDANDSIVSYSWQFVGRNTATTYTRSDAYGSLTITVVDIYDVTLTVEDEYGAIDQDTAVYTANNCLPVAVAGRRRYPIRRHTVFLRRARKLRQLWNHCLLLLEIRRPKHRNGFHQRCFIRPPIALSRRYLRRNADR